MKNLNQDYNFGKSLIQFIKESLKYSSIVTESFSCTYLKDVANLFDEATKEFEEMIASDPKQYRPSRYYTTFKSLIGYHHSIRYDKIKDEDFQEFAGNDGKLHSLIRRILQSKDKGVAVGYKDGTPSAVLINGDIYYLPKFAGYYDKYEAHQKQNGPQYSMIGVFSSLDMVAICNIKPEKGNPLYIDANDEDSPSTRNRNRSGMVRQGDDEYYRSVAESNIMRYKEIISKNKANKLDDEELNDKITELMNELAAINERYFQLDEDTMKNYKYNYQRIINIIAAGNNSVMKIYWEYAKYKDWVKQGTTSSYIEKDMYTNRKTLLDSIDIANKEIKKLPF